MLERPTSFFTRGRKSKNYKKPHKANNRKDYKNKPNDSASVNTFFIHRTPQNKGAKLIAPRD